MHELKLQKDAEDRRNKEILDQARELGKKLEASTVKLQIKAGEGGRTFGSISTKEIATSLKEQAGIDIDRKKIQLSDPIKNVGSYTVGVKLHPEITANIKVVVEAV